MHIMYVDESGDPGRSKYSSEHYILSGLVVSQERWKTYLDRLKTLRKTIKEEYGLNQREEIHAAELIRINKTKAYQTIRKAKRIELLKVYCQQIPLVFDTAKIINICLKKSDFDEQTDIQIKAWNRLIQRFDTYLKKDAKDKGIIVTDDTDSAKLIQLMRKMRVYNPISSHFGDEPHNTPTDNIIEDLFQRSSHHSYFIQSVDVVAHLLYRKEFPKGSLKKYRMEYCFNQLDSILLKKAAKNDPYGIVRK